MTFLSMRLSVHSINIALKSDNIRRSGNNLLVEQCVVSIRTHAAVYSC